jgi:multidrug efflux system membrane fusion protein
MGLAVLFLTMALAGCKPQSQTPPPSGGRGGGRGGGFGPVVISTATANSGSIGVYVNALGVVTPLKTVSITSRVQGQIVEVKYQEGQMVKAGDPLIEIDPGPSQASLTQAEGQLKRDSAILTDAKLDLERYQEAYASNAIPRQQLDTQVANVEQDEGTVKLDQGLLDNAKVQLGYCHITAPISGRVGLRLVDEGNMVQANSTTALAVITQLHPITVIFNVAEDDLPPILEQLRAGKTLTVDAFDRAQTKKLATGTLETLDNQIDPSTGTVKFRAVFNNEDESLFPNQFVNARLLVKTLEGATLLPNSVIQRNADGAFVYVVKQDSSGAQTNVPQINAAGTAGQTASTNTPMATGTVTLQTITTGTTDGNVTAVEGIDPGTVVAADSFNKLTDGAKVMIRPGGSGHAGGRGGAGSGKGSHQKNAEQQQQSQ